MTRDPHESMDLSWTDESRPPFWRSNRIAWFLVIALAWWAFDLAVGAVISVLIGCVKFGWDELKRARRRRRLDPNQARGRACSWFTLAFGFWKISLVATGLMFALSFVLGIVEAQARGVGGPRREGPPAEFMAACLLAFGGFLFSGLISLVAVVSAVRNQVKVWVGRDRNRVKDVLLTALVINLTVALFVLIFPLLLGLRAAGGAGPMFGWIFGFCFVAYPVLLLVLLDWLRKRIVAENPWECWPELLLPAHERPTFLADILDPAFRTEPT